MNAPSVQFTDVLEFQPDHGLIRLHDQRMLMMGAAAMGLLRKELIDSVGAPSARRLLMRFGFADGYHDAVSLRDKSAWSDPVEGLRAGFALHAFEGIVRTVPRRLEYDAGRQRLDCEFEWHNSYEAEQHVQQCGRSDDPVCWTLVGYLSGYASACLGHEVFFQERQCVGRGAMHCELVGHDAAGWGAEAPGFRRDFQGTELSEAVDGLRLAARRREQELARRERALEHRERELDVLRQRVARHAASKHFIVKSRAMQGVLEQAARVAPLDTTVLLQGESGTGKEYVARMIHDQSPRSGRPLVSVNCAALTETLLESELFGHVRGAFTGAVRDKPGLFEVASEGTLFLDEVGEMSPALQAKLLRALQEGEIRRVGGERSIKVSPRVIAATNRDLKAASAAGSFREDLYFRLGAFVIVVPPLRDRREAIPVMALEFLRRAAARFKKDVRSIAPDAMSALVAYRWPGNVRQLENAIERAVILAQDTTVTREELPQELFEGNTRMLPDDNLELEAHERRLIHLALERHAGNRRKAAEALRISTVTLWRKMKQYGLSG